MLPKNIATTPRRYISATAGGEWGRGRTGCEDELVEVDLVRDGLQGRRELQPVQELKPLRQDGPEYRAWALGVRMSTLRPDAGVLRADEGERWDVPP